MKRKKIEPKSAVSKIKNFYKRWNITLPEKEKFEKFKNRVINVVAKNVGQNLDNDTVFAKEYLHLIGERTECKIKSLDLNWQLKDIYIKETLIYQSLVREKDFSQFVLKMQAFFWCKSLDKNQKKYLFKDFEKTIKISSVPIELKKTKREYLFYPAGVKLLDRKVINDVLDWLDDYPKVDKYFNLSLNQYMRGASQRNILDNLRFALEQLLRTLLKNKKSIEKQKEELLKFLKDKSVNQEVINMYNTLILQYVKYQNENVKHGDKLSESEIEFIIYLTGTFMRFLLQIKEM